MSKAGVKDEVSLLVRLYRHKEDDELIITHLQSVGNKNEFVKKALLSYINNKPSEAKLDTEMSSLLVDTLKQLNDNTHLLFDKIKNFEPKVVQVEKEYSTEPEPINEIDICSNTDEELKGDAVDAMMDFVSFLN